MLNLRTKGFNNAVAVLGGYDAMVKAGLPTETGKPGAAKETDKTKTAPATAAGKSPASTPQTAAPASSATANTSAAPAAAANSTDGAQEKRSKRHKARAKH